MKELKHNTGTLQGNSVIKQKTTTSAKTERQKKEIREGPAVALAEEKWGLRKSIALAKDTTRERPLRGYAQISTLLLSPS